jgi:DNA replication protein DnaC
MQVFIYVMSLVLSKIPRDYWALKLDELQIAEKYLNLVGYYIENLQGAVAHAKGLIFHGSNGIGKTSLMCEVGKAAVAAGYTVQYFTAQQYIDTKNDKNQDFKSYESSQFILLDEIDKVYINQKTGFATKTLEEFIRRSLTAGKCMLICSNLDRDEFTEIFGDSLTSMVRRHMRVVDVVGSDFSSNLYDGWSDQMESHTYDYFSESIIEMAEILNQQEREGYLG